MQCRVADIAAAKRWYERLLDRAANFVPGGDIAEWELYPNCWLQVAEGDANPGSNRIRFGVRDVRSEMERLTEELGINISTLSVVEEIVAYCDFEDPDGNRLGLFQDLARSPL